MNDDRKAGEQPIADSGSAAEAAGPGPTSSAEPAALREAGFHDVRRKPFHIETLAHVLRRTLDED